MKVIVYVITSPISIVVLSAVLTGFVIAVLTGVVVGGVGFVVVIAGFVWIWLIRKCCGSDISD
ncbi:hypothetical protein ACT7DA_04530 [Bacillus pacificus]